MAITRRAVQEWLQSEVTKAYFAGIKYEIEGIKEGLSYGQTIEGTSDTSGMATARAVGRIEGLRDALDVNIETVIEGD